MFKLSSFNINSKCWLFTGYKTEKGYGEVTFKGRTYKVHRISAYIFLSLDILDNLIQVNHKLGCGNKNCWNPEHLYIGTNSENQQDSIIAGGRIQKTHCKYGHELTKNNIYLGKRGQRNCKICTKDRANYRYELIK